MASRTKRRAGGATAANDLTRNIEPTPEELTASLHCAYSQSQLYSWAGTNCMVAVAPPQMSTIAVEIASDETRSLWFKEYKSFHGSAWPPSKTNATKLPLPHVFAVANAVYFQMRRSGLDQSVFLCGESGCAKTFQADLIMKQLCDISGSAKHDDRIQPRVQAVMTVLNAFGCAKTSASDDSSRYGACFELQFSDRGKLLGLKTILYSLDIERLASQRVGERSFHAFYYLLAGAPQDLREQLYLAPLGPYNFLTGGCAPVPFIDDSSRFSSWLEAMRVVGIGRRLQTYLASLLAAILHLGNISFADGNEGCLVQNPEALNLVAALLEVNPEALQGALTSKISLVGRDITSMLLSSDEANAARDSLASSIYHMMVLWVVEHMNKKLSSESDAKNYISIVDFPGTSAANSDDPSCFRFGYCNERLQALIYKRLFNYGNQELRSQGMPIQDSSYNVSSDYINEMNRRPAAADIMISPDLLRLILGGKGISGTRSQFLQSVFGDAIHASELAEEQMLHQRTPQYKAWSPRPIIFRRLPSTLSRLGETQEHSHAVPGSLISEIDALIEGLQLTNSKVVFCVPQNPDRGATAFDDRFVRAQIQKHRVPELVAFLASRGGANYTIRYPIADFLQKYATLFSISPEGSTDSANRIVEKLALPKTDIYVGSSLVIMRDELYVYLENALRRNEQEDKIRAKKGLPPRNLTIDGKSENQLDGSESFFSGANSEDEANSNFGADDTTYDGEASSPFPTRGVKNGLSKQQHQKQPQEPINLNHGKYLAAHELAPEPTEPKRTLSRNIWVFITFFLTWWIPSPLMMLCGKRRSDIRMAWREKVAICILILICCCLQIFLVIGFGQILCPRQNILNSNELFFSSSDSDPLVAIYGIIYNLNSFFTKVYHSPSFMNGFGGLDITAGFPRTPAYYCTYARDRQPNSPAFYNTSTTFLNGTFIQARHYNLYTRGLYEAERLIDNTLKKNVYKLLAWSMEDIHNMSTRSTTGRLHKMYAINSRVYDLQPYRDSLPSGDADFLPSSILNYLDGKAGQDLTLDNKFMSLWRLDRNLRDCWNNLFVVGVVDYRKSTRCLFTNYVLVAFSVLVVSVIGAKFLAALQFSSTGSPEEHDKFVILQVPCYTEGEESLRRTIDSLATLDYDDKRKLLMIVCDGNIMGTGNDRPTPRIVLDILGIDHAVDPEPMSFQSVGDGIKQHNMAKVYSGLYEVQGHLVPYLVVVKVGTPSESSKPGNRGKRDSQMVLMRFLNHFYLDLPMSPLELEMCHQIKNVIGVNPAFYEYSLMVDADTVVHQDSLTRLVSVMMHDTKVMGVCGETQLSNEKDSWATMIQVYEYYISHHLSKAFESLFGTVTCLPGCFSMYRLRSPAKNTPLLASSALVSGYGDVNVITLHEKNLLSLGEDRYLTTLMLKNFPNMRTVFTPHAKCDTVAPERWSVLLSQRRRWINSTVHNLFELLNIDAMCGFCCFSMRFVVLLDLIATIIQPAIVVYLGYLIYLVISTIWNSDPNSFPMISLILLGVIYGLQAIIFLIKREWQHVGWMFIYLLAIPVFSFMIPLYSFWHMDDFGWGSTRMVYGESKKGTDKKAAEKGKEAEFDIRNIPHKRWLEYESELWAQHGAKMEAMGVSGPATGGENLSPRHAGDGGGNGGTGSIIGSSFGGGGSRSHQYQYQQQQQNQSPSRSRFNAMPGTPSESNFSFNGGSSVSQLRGARGDGTGPTNDDIYAELEKILAASDLMTITKRQVRDELSSQLHVDLTNRREIINKFIAEILSRHV